MLKQANSPSSPSNTGAGNIINMIIFVEKPINPIKIPQWQINKIKQISSN